MKILGLILMITGGLLFYGSKIFTNRNKKRIENEEMDSKDSEFFLLINNALYAIRAIGAIMVISGGIIILFTK